jgi:hypothetical protein
MDGFYYIHHVEALDDDPAHPSNLPGAMAYRPVCNYDEIQRIYFPKNGSDLLLKMRADVVAEKIRIYRVLTARQKRVGEKWNFSTHFRRRDFRKYLRRLSSEDWKKCSVATYGFVYSDDPNGACIKSEFGNIIVISESLNYFFYFMNLAFVRFDEEVPGDVIWAALIIAMRSMLQTESMDYELDPRGIIPASIDCRIKKIVNNQLQFIIGHEFAHHICDHIENSGSYQRTLIENSDASEATYVFYNHQQQQEFEADEQAIFRSTDHQHRFDQLSGAILFFIYLDVFEHVKNHIYPPIRPVITHPSPIDRLNRLVETFRPYLPDDIDDHISNLKNVGNLFKSSLGEEATLNPDVFDFYGSVYLGQWRGPELIDRVDY